MTALGLHALQHRGQAAGIMSFDGEDFMLIRRWVLLIQLFSKHKVISKLKVIGHRAQTVIPRGGLSS